MATESDIATLRGFIAETTNAEPWTDVYLGLLIDSNNGDIRAAAADIWSRKASDSALLVDVSENGSSRKMSDVHKNALAMARMYRAESIDLQVVVTGRPTTRAIVRP